MDPSAPPAYAEIYPRFYVEEIYQKVLVPGIGGSKLYCHCQEERKKLYPSRLPGFWNLSQHFFECKDVRPEILARVYGISVYHNFIERNGGMEAFAYDWRLPALKLAMELEAHLEGGTKRLVLVGHSLGGLIIRILIEHLKPKGIIDRLEKVFICGTPFIGSQDTNDYNCELQILPVLTRARKFIKLQSRPFVLTKRDIYRYFKQFGTALLYLAPSFEIESLTMEQLDLGRAIMNLEQLNNLKEVHLDLARFSFPPNTEYIFFFNTSRKIDVTHVMDRNLMEHITKGSSDKHIEKIKSISNTNELWYVVRRRESDGLVLACHNVPTGAITWFDRSMGSHALLMNSRRLSDLI